ncbi:YeiH family protein [Phycicoccus elongatus]|uniref:YeiH family protein n=1 Tax=Phycicoccus elongatus TaxID=101689 RepID=UPI00059477B1|nr:putative sulfate exporter family transporter [Phycicoccus elongatus]
MTPAGRGPKLPTRLAWVPGVALSFAVALAALALHRAVPMVNAVLVCIILGALAGNLIRIPATFAPGLAMSARRVLRIGIVILGLQLSLTQIAALGPGMLIVVVAVVGGGILGTLAIGRLLRVPMAQRLLIATGFSICGAAAVAAVEGTIDREDEDVAASIALVVLFGTLMIPLIPLLVGLLSMDIHSGGLLAGAATHEVAQVVAIGSLLGPDAVGAAVVVKLARVALLAPVVVTVGWAVARGRARVADQGGSATRATKKPPIIPLFLVGFLAASVIATVFSPSAGVLHLASSVQSLCLGAAMFALGISVRVSILRNLGPRPLVLGFLSTLLVLVIALTGIALVA